MKVKFKKSGVFTSLESPSFGGNKSKVDQIMDLPSDEANEYIQKGWCVPEGKVVEANESDEDDFNLLDEDEDEAEGED